jgi:hypothetical protein
MSCRTSLRPTKVPMNALFESLFVKYRSYLPCTEAVRLYFHAMYPTNESALETPLSPRSSLFYNPITGIT